MCFFIMYLYISPLVAIYTIHIYLPLLDSIFSCRIHLSTIRIGYNVYSMYFIIICIEYLLYCTVPAKTPFSPPPPPPPPHQLYPERRRKVNLNPSNPIHPSIRLSIPATTVGFPTPHKSIDNVEPNL